MHLYLIVILLPFQKILLYIHFVPYFHSKGPIIRSINSRPSQETCITIGLILGEVEVGMFQTHCAYIELCILAILACNPCMILGHAEPFVLNKVLLD